jgi:YHS domain-containing protein
MKQGIRTAIAFLALLPAPVAVLAQHEGHQAGGQAGDQACLGRAKESLRIVEAADRRLEEARQTNSPRQMRAAVDDLQAALVEVKTQLSLCVTPAAGGAGSGMQGMDHSGMKEIDRMAAPPKSPAPPRKTEGMDHSQMDRSKTSAPRTTAPPKPAEPAPTSHEEKEASQVPPQTITKDPVCGMEVGPEATQKAIYQGKTYYFCSRADREKFLSDPEAYVNR